jgi:hypothetical protein
MMTQNVPKRPVGENDLNEYGLSEKQLAVIDLLVMGKSYQFTADALAVTRKTVYRWRQDEDFKRALSERRRERWSSATDRLQSMIDRSLDVMEQHLNDRYDRSRFRAATAVLRVAGLNKCMPQRPTENDDE